MLSLLVWVCSRSTPYAFGFLHHYTTYEIFTHRVCELKSNGVVALEKGETPLQQQSRTGIYGIAPFSLKTSMAEPLITLKYLQM